MSNESTMRLNYKRTILVGFAFFLICAFWQAYDTIVPLILTNRFKMSQSWSGLIMALDNIFAVVLLPIFGNISDKASSRLGRRTPFILAGTVAAALFFSILGLVQSLPVFIAVLLCTLLSMATFRSPAVALMPDVTVKPLRSKGNAIINLMGTAGGMIVLALATVFGTSEKGKTDFSAYMITVCGIMLIALGVFILTVRENKWAAEMESDTVRFNCDAESAERTSAGRLSRSQFASLILILASVALWYTGYNAVTSKYSVYASDMLGVSYSTTLLLANAAAVVAYIPIGFLSSRLGRKKSILIGVVCLAAAFAGAGFLRWGPAVPADGAITVSNDSERTAEFTISLSDSEIGGAYGDLSFDEGKCVISLEPGQSATASGLPADGVMYKIVESGKLNVSVIVMDVLFVLAGIGWATINVNSFPMVVELAKSGDVGKYTGFYYTASMAAQIVTPILSGVLMDGFGMRVLFPYAAVFSVLSFITMCFVRHGDSKPAPQGGLEAFADAD